MWGRRPTQSRGRGRCRSRCGTGPQWARTLQVRRRLRLDGGDLDLQDDLVGNHDAGVQRGLPVDAEFLAVDGAGGGEADALQVVDVDVGALELDVEIDGLGDALDGQIAGEHALVVAR